MFGYVRCSTEEQADSGAGLDAQRAAIEAECERRGWKLADVIVDAGYSAKNLNRPGIRSALSGLKRGDADVLMVSRLDRLSRSLLDFAGIMQRAQRQGWSVVALDLGMDTSSPAGEAMANVLATFAQFQRRLIGVRTKEAMAAKKAQGATFGRPRLVPADVTARILRERKRKSYQAIAEGLNATGVPTAHGGERWHASTVRAVALSRT